ncbi:Gfo/Idh/MocA family oxidoreductase [Rubripirellula amarantea]|nr:Gfo/Idh/MocA family oxidoreductase [Rubripirellula amarantea]
MSKSTCRWGILSTAGIARKIWNAIEVSENGCVVAVASRNEAKAQRFIDECSAQTAPEQSVQAVGDYESLIADPDIDAIYVPLPTGLRKSYVVAAAKAGKHVLCEKPVAIHSSDLEEMVGACEAAGVQFIDGVMFDHSQRWEALKSTLLNESPIGKVRRIQTHFSFAGDATFKSSNIRTDATLEPHGCLGDLGWYCIRFTLGIMGGHMPQSIRASTVTPIKGEGSASDVPGEFAADMTFEGGVTASFFCSFLCENQQTAWISGEQGYVSLDDFVLPLLGDHTHYDVHHHQLLIDGCRWHFHRNSETVEFDEPACDQAGAQEIAMVTRLAEAAITGEVDARYHDLARRTQLVLDACRRSDAAGGQVITI